MSPISTTPGQSEDLKCGWHGALAVCAVGAMGYNWAAWLRRRQGRLARNAVLYTGLTLFELSQVRHHWRQR